MHSCHFRARLSSPACIATAILLGSPSLALAADMPLAAGPRTPTPPPPAISGLQYEFGGRYWFSSGDHGFDLYDPLISRQLNSRLTFADLTGQTAEIFYRADFEPGVFLKGFVGGGAITSGKLNDEDFPISSDFPYSNTISNQSGGSLKYATVDLGYNLYRGALPGGQPVRIGPFIGYNHYHQRINTFGCNQVSANPQICGVIPPAFTPIPTDVDVLDADASWNSLRAGVEGEVVLLPRVRAKMEAAWTRNWVWNTDYHNLRPDIRAMQQSGQGNGFQIEGLLNYDLTPQFSIGLGGRYWQFNANGKNHWERKFSGAYFGVPSSPLNTRSERFGLFLQAGYRFGGLDSNALPADSTQDVGLMVAPKSTGRHEWSGVHLGASVGYAWGVGRATTLTPLSPAALQSSVEGATPLSQKSDVAGFSGGGQIGYDYQFHRIFLAGIESDFGYAPIGGSYADTDLLAYVYGLRPFAGLTTSTKQNMYWLTTTRARFGPAVTDDLLFYVTGGFAAAQVSARGAIGQFGVNCNYLLCSQGGASQVATGWTAGLGVEYAVARDFSLKTEWLYLGLPKTTYSVAAIGAGSADMPINIMASSGNSAQLVRAGVNYRIPDFEPASRIVAKY